MGTVPVPAFLAGASAGYLMRLSKHFLMKTNLLLWITILLSVVFLSSCGGGGASKKLKTNEYLGDLPAIAHHFRTVDSAIKADEKAQYEKYGEKITMDKAMGIAQKAENKKRQNQQKWEDGIAKEKAMLGGKDIPFEIKMPCYEISCLKIIDVFPYSVRTTGTIIIKEEMPAPRTVNFQKALDIYCVFLDKNDKIINYRILSPVVGDYKKTSALPGERYNLDMHIAFGPDNIPKWADFSKAVFISEEEFKTIPK